MALVDLVMPKLGESIMEATILKWTKNIGDAVKADETLLEIATDKVDSEVPSTTEGTLTEILYKVNDVVPIGTVIARINTEAKIDTPPQETNHGAPAGNEDGDDDIEEQVPFVPQATPQPVKTNGGSNNKFYSPLVLNIANSEGLPLSELESIPGTGSEGRVTKSDVLQYIAKRKSGKPQTIQQPATSQATPPPQEAAQPTRESTSVENETAPPQSSSSPGAETVTRKTDNTEIIEMDRMRKMISKHMVSSKQISAHVTSFAEADVTNMVLWREKVKKDFEKVEGTKMTYMPMLLACLARVIKRYPYINCSVEDEKIILKKDINIGMATALPSGNLIVPVIKNADYLNLVGLSKSVNALADNARNNRLKPDDISGGTFTISNVGTFGSLMGTPIINQPEVAILAVGIIKKRPVVLETPEGDVIGIRHMMYLSLSYDHRIVDGSVGAGFLTDVAKEFENWDVTQKW
jgi:2-oxoglutarate dehydrogenase E2 component (dihydrolipoamide succinyltransferase)